MIDSLNAMLAVLKIVEIVAVTAIVLLAVDLTYYNYQDRKAVIASDAIKAKHAENEARQLIADLKYWIIEIRVVHLYATVKAAKEDKKTQIRREKEASANGGFFEESYLSGFGPTGNLLYSGEHRFPTAEMAVLTKTMDRRADDAILDITEEF